MVIAIGVVGLVASVLTVVFLLLAVVTGPIGGFVVFVESVLPFFESSGFLDGDSVVVEVLTGFMLFSPLRGILSKLSVSFLPLGLTLVDDVTTVVGTVVVSVILLILVVMVGETVVVVPVMCVMLLLIVVYWVFFTSVIGFGVLVVVLLVVVWFLSIFTKKKLYKKISFIPNENLWIMCVFTILEWSDRVIDLICVQLSNENQCS